MELTDVIGAFPYRMALAGGWIDQPFMSRLDPQPPGAMVVVSLEPTVRFMDRCGMATGTRKVAMDLWGGSVPAGDPADLVRQLYEAENRDKPEPSGSQDMIGLLYPGVCRLDYSAACEGGTFPGHIEQTCDEAIARWIERVIHFVPVCPRPEGYSPLGVKMLERHWVRRLGRSGRNCWDAIVAMDLDALGASMNECMRCWEALLPDVVHHSTLTVDLMALLGAYQARCAGAMYSGCGGGYLIAASEAPVPGAFQVKVRLP